MNADALKSLMDRMREPEPPPGFERIVMARIVRVAETRPTAARPAVVPRERETPAPAWLDAPAWLGSAVGLAVFFVSWIAGHLAGDGLTRILASPQAATALMSSMPASLPAFAGLGIGVALFVAGLFTPDRRRQVTTGDGR